MGVVGYSVARHFAIDPGAPRFCALVLLENQHRRAFAHYEAISVLVERTGGRLGLLIARRHRADQSKCSEAEWRERCFRSTGDHHIRVAVPYLTERVSDSDRTRCTAHGVGRIRTHDSELDCDVAARGS